MESKYKTIDYKFSELCAEIDDLKAETEYLKSEYEKERQLNIDSMNRDLERSQKGIANALMFSLMVKDDENGNLVIDKKGNFVTIQGIHLKIVLMLGIMPNNAL